MTPLARILTAPVVALALVAMPFGSFAQAPAPAKGGGAAQPAMSQDKLDSLLAPIALYPDQLLVQALMASTYPLDVVEAARFVKANKELKGDAMVKAAEAKNWDPSVQSLTAYPQVLEMMNDKLDWTQELGDAVLADEAAVMQTVQGLRQKAQASGNLKSNEQQKVVQQEKTIIIEPAQPQTIYVPTYNPTVVYGTWWAPTYPPYYWPPPAYYYPGYAVGAGLVGFGLGLAVGSACCWGGANWGNNFVRNNNNAEFKNKVQNGNWQHNPSQRKGVAYRDQGTRDRFAKSDPGAASARRDYRGYDGAGNRGAGDRAGAGTMDRGGAGNRAGPSAGTMDRPGGGGGGIDRGDGPGASNRMGAGGAADRMGAGGAGDRGGAGAANRAGGGQSFGGGGGGYGNASGAKSFNSGQSRAQTQNYSSRGAASRSSMGGGGRGGGGGGGGGGRRR